MTMRIFAIILVALTVGALGRRGPPRKEFDVDEFVSQSTDLVQAMLDGCEVSDSPSVEDPEVEEQLETEARRLLRGNHGRSKDSRFQVMFTKVFGEDYCSKIAGMDAAVVAQDLAERLFVDKFAHMATKFIEQIREEKCKTEEVPEVEEALETADQEENEDVLAALRRSLHHPRKDDKEVPEGFMTTFEEFFSEGYCSDKTNEELAKELGKAVLDGDVVLEKPVEEDKEVVSEEGEAVEKPHHGHGRGRGRGLRKQSTRKD